MTKLLRNYDDSDGNKKEARRNVPSELLSETPHHIPTSLVPRLTCESCPVGPPSQRVAFTPTSPFLSHCPTNEMKSWLSWHAGKFLHTPFPPCKLSIMASTKPLTSKYLFFPHLLSTPPLTTRYVSLPHLLSQAINRTALTIPSLPSIHLTSLCQVNNSRSSR